MQEPFELPAADLAGAADVIELCGNVVGRAIRQLAAGGGPDEHQVLAYDISHAAAQVAAAKSMLDYGAKGDLEARLTCAFTADVTHDLISRLCGREAMWGLDQAPLRNAHAFLERFRTPEFIASLADRPGPRHLDAEFEMVQDTFRSFAENEIVPRAEHVHRHNGDVPEELIAESRRDGCRSVSACRPSTAGTARAATVSTSPWSWPPKSSAAVRSASAAR